MERGLGQEEAQVTIISREFNAGASTTSYDGFAYVTPEMIKKYDEAYCVTRTKKKKRWGGGPNSHTSQTVSIPDNISNSLQKKSTKTLASVGRNQKNKCKISENDEGVSPKLKRRKVTRNPKGSKDSDASNILDTSFVQTDSGDVRMVDELQATWLPVALAKSMMCPRKWIFDRHLRALQGRLRKTMERLGQLENLV